MITEFRTAPILSNDGMVCWTGLSKTGEMVVARGHARYYEAVSRGRMYYTVFKNTAPTASNTTLGNFIYNPIGSTVNLSLVEITASGMLDTALASITVLKILCSRNPTESAPTGLSANNVISNCLIGGPSGVAQAYTTGTSATSINTSLVGFAGNISLTTVSSAAVAFMKSNFCFNPEGFFIMPPNTWMTMGTSSGNFKIHYATVVWEEIPII